MRTLVISSLTALTLLAGTSKATEAPLAPTATGVSPGTPMRVPRAAHGATLLRNGRVLITGGMRADEQPLASAEVYDRRMRRFLRTGSLTTRRVGHAALRLRSGRVLVVGGWGGSAWLASAEVYDPGIGRFRRTGSMAEPRGGGAATTLADGRVLVTGGPGSSAEVYDPATGRFGATGAMGAQRVAHTATLLRDGRVLVTGGSNASGVLAAAELYDPRTGRFTPTGALTVPRHKHTARRLPDGRVLIAGGSNDRDWQGRYASTEIYDPARGTFAPAAPMAAQRFKLDEATAVLRDGRIVLAGGSTRVEAYDPRRETFTALRGSLDAPRFFSTATLLQDGSVLIVGGYDPGIRPTNRTWLLRP